MRGRCLKDLRQRNGSRPNRETYVVPSKVGGKKRGQNGWKSKDERDIHRERPIERTGSRSSLELSTAWGGRIKGPDYGRVSGRQGA